MPDGNPAVWHTISFIKCLIKAELNYMETFKLSFFGKKEHHQLRAPQKQAETSK
jgi:hypothetical protein